MRSLSRKKLPLRNNFLLNICPPAAKVGGLFPLTALKEGGSSLPPQVAPAAPVPAGKARRNRPMDGLTCGTCLHYYGLAERLAVGGVTNMYAIVETLANAGKVIQP